MFIAGILVAAHFLLVHAPNGQEIVLHIEEISTVRDVSVKKDSSHHTETKCVIVMTNGNTLGIRESCREVLTTIDTLRNGNGQ